MCVLNNMFEDKNLYLVIFVVIRMGFWFNNFMEFEKKRNVNNSLVLNFHYVAEPEEAEKSVKVFVPYDVQIPTNFLIDDAVENIFMKIKNDELLKLFPVEVKKISKWNVLNIKLPKNSQLVGKESRLSKISRHFQIGNYDKLLRFEGFFPERKVRLTKSIEQIFSEKEVVELENLNEINFGDFLSLKDVKSLPYLVIDIEKPLWKKDSEKKLLNLRNKLLKREKEYNNLKIKSEDGEIKHTKRKRIIGKLEDRLKANVFGVGDVNLYEEKYNSDISFVGTIWGNNHEQLRELYVIDPKNEITYDKFNDFKVIKFKNEKSLVSGLLKKIHERKPIISYGHNQVYDFTQLRFAAEKEKIVFDPAIKEIKPRRDFVRSFLQRLREDLVYIDSLWLSKIYYPYLNQKRFGTNHKLDSVARFLGINFEKSLTHEQLREVELRRLFGVSKSIREDSIKKMLNYTTDDLDNTIKIIEKINPWPLLLDIKNILPFCTYSEIAFSTNCMNKLHEFRHFKNSGNLPYYKYKQKERLNEINIFKKRFSSKKNQLLRWAGMKRAAKENYSDVQEFYLPLEEWLKDIAFKIEPCLEGIWGKTKDEETQHFAFLQFLKSFMSPVFTDYYFARREEKVYNFTRKFFDFEKLEFSNNFDISLLNSLIGSFRYLKNNFRSIYVSLDGFGRARIRQTKKNLSKIEFPEIMQEDSDLFLLRENADLLKDKLSPANKKVLTSFLKNFDEFENLVQEIGGFVKNYSYDSLNLLYSYIQETRALNKERMFFAKYGSSVEQFKNLIGNSYKDLASQLKNNDLKFIDNLGDYILVSGNKKLPCAKHIRNIGDYTLTD